jgi:epoxyqueuosine reductase
VRRSRAKDARQRARDLLGMTPEAFGRPCKGSPTKRAELRGLMRKAAVVPGNVGTVEAVPVLEQALADPEPLVRGHAARALGRIGSAGALEPLPARDAVEPER